MYSHTHHIRGNSSGEQEQASVAIVTPNLPITTAQPLRYYRDGSLFGGGIRWQFAITKPPKKAIPVAFVPRDSISSTEEENLQTAKIPQKSFLNRISGGCIPF